MKNFITLLCIAAFSFLTAQNQYPKIETIQVNEKEFFAKFNNKPLKFHITFNKYSTYHRGVYSVKGWYIYNNTTQKIKLVGIYNQGELVLYKFNKKSNEHILLNLIDPYDDFWSDLKYYKNLDGFDEKFVFNNENNHVWINKNKTHKLILKETDLRVKKNFEFLKLNPNTSFELDKWHRNYSVVANNKQQVILKFEHNSKLYAMGRCGAGTEIGFILLNFNKDFTSFSSKIFLIESCLLSIETEDKKKVSDRVYHYVCKNYSDSETYTLIVDTIKASIVKK